MSYNVTTFYPQYGGRYQLSPCITVENAYLAAALASGRGVKNNYIFGIPNPDLPIYYIVRSVAVVQSVHPISCTLSSVSLEYSEYTPLSFTS